MTKTSKKNQKTETPKRLNRCKSITELKAFLESSTKPTAKFDLLLIRGGKVSELLKAFEKLRGESKDFKTASKIKAHIQHREKAGWVFEKKDAEGKDPYFKLSKIS